MTDARFGFQGTVGPIEPRKSDPGAAARTPDSP